MPPRPTAAFVLRYLDSRLALRLYDGVDADPLLSFLSSHFGIEPEGDPGAAAPFAELRVASSADDLGIAVPDAPAHEVFLRKSAAEFFTISALHRTGHGPSGPVDMLTCTRSGTLIALDAAHARIDVVLGEKPGLELIELVRDAVQKHQENQGAAVLHATAVHTDGGVVLVAGAKGAGKSTVALELADALGARVLSGDKAIAHPGADGGPALCSGWPDYPHLGFGTLAKYPELMRAAGLDPDHRPDPGHAFSPLGKYAVPPEGFRRRFPAPPVGTRSPIRAVVYPDIGPGERTVLAATEHDAERAASFLESAFTASEAFRHGVVPDRTASGSERRETAVRAIAAVPAFSVTGPGVLTADDCAPVERALRAAPRAC